MEVWMRLISFFFHSLQKSNSKRKFKMKKEKAIMESFYRKQWRNQRPWVIFQGHESCTLLLNYISI